MNEEIAPYYEPWEGPRFRSDPHAGVKLLLMGESSYKRGPEHASPPDHLRSDTQRLVDGNFYGGAKSSGFWRYIQRSVSGEQEITAASQQLFWSGVALANVVQRPMENSKARPAPVDYVEGAKTIRSYIETLTPRALIIYTKSAWTAVHSACQLEAVGRSALCEQAQTPPILKESGIYWRSGVLGENSPWFLLVQHPSARRPRIAGRIWYELIGPFLDCVRHRAN